MKRFLKERGTEVGASVWYTLLTLLVIAIFALGYLGVSKVVYPW